MTAIARETVARNWRFRRLSTRLRPSDNRRARARYAGLTYQLIAWSPERPWSGLPWSGGKEAMANG